VKILMLKFCEKSPYIRITYTTYTCAMECGENLRKVRQMFLDDECWRLVLSEMRLVLPFNQLKLSPTFYETIKI